MNDVPRPQKLLCTWHVDRDREYSKIRSAGHKNNLAVSAPFAQIKFGYFISKRGEINEMFGLF